MPARVRRFGAGQMGAKYIKKKIVLLLSLFHIYKKFEKKVLFQEIMLDFSLKTRIAVKKYIITRVATIDFYAFTLYIN